MQAQAPTSRPGCPETFVHRSDGTTGFYPRGLRIRVFCWATPPESRNSGGA